MQVGEIVNRSNQKVTCGRVWVICGPINTIKKKIMIVLKEKEVGTTGAVVLLVIDNVKNKKDYRMPPLRRALVDKCVENDTNFAGVRHQFA